MENLKSVLADKIIDISSEGGDDIKAKLDKINRFRDFAHACESLMEKYPSIESELIRMVKNNDFDTKIASSRVDSIIRLSENEKGKEEATKEDLSEFEEIKENIITKDITEPLYTPPPKEIAEEILTENQTFSQTAEDTDYEKIPPEEKEINGEYVDFEEIRNDDNPEKVSPVITDHSSGEEEYETITGTPSNKRKENIKKGAQVTGVIVSIVLLIFVVVFIINNWKAILYVLGGAALLGLIFWILFMKYKK